MPHLLKDITGRKLQRPSAILVSGAVVFCCLVAACSPRIRQPQSPVALPDEFSASGDYVLPARWWLSFDDPQLDALIDEALSENFTIRSAWDRLTQAEQIAVRTGAALLPQVDYSASGSRTWAEDSRGSSASSDYSAGLFASYEVDLWNRIESAHQAALLDAAALREDVQAAAVTVSAAVAQTWYQLAEAKQQELVLLSQIETNSKVLQIITVQFQKGGVGAADVYRQRQLVESTRGQLIQVREDIILLLHQLSVLLGRRPAQWWQEEDIALIQPPPFPRLGLPASVVQVRPDVQSSYRLIQAADLRVAAAIADRYPAIGVFAAAETSAGKVRELFDDWFANLAAEAVGPLFDAGLRKAEVERTRAVLSQRINDYGQTVLKAVREIEDAINQEIYQRQYLENLEKQLELSRQVSERTEQNYLKGRLDYIRVLETLVSQQNLERNVVNARRVLLYRRIELCRAVAAGWDMSRPHAQEM